MGELELVRALRAALPPGRLEVGIGDDAAVAPVQGDRVVVSTDAMVEGVHFRSAWATPEDVGWRACAAALSDLAAMGAVAGEVYLAIAVPAGFSQPQVLSLVAGAQAVAANAGAVVAGGDLTTGPALSVTVTVVGWLRAGDRVLRRNGARDGDLVGVTGHLGGAAAALRAMAASHALDPRAERPAVALEPLLRPQARLAFGRALAAAGASAAIDLSDGLASDATRIAEESGVRLELRLADLPVAPGADPELAATGGEDFELCVCAPSQARRACEAAVPTLRWVGRVVEGEPEAVFVDAAGPLRGYEHAL